MKSSSQTSVHSSQLVIEVEDKQAVVLYGHKRAKVQLRKKPLLAGIAKVVGRSSEIQGLEVEIKNATFSTTRQVVAQINTLAWGLGLKVNGQRQLQAKYSGEPNITTPCRN